MQYCISSAAHSATRHSHHWRRHQDCTLKQQHATGVYSHSMTGLKKISGFRLLLRLSGPSRAG